MVLGAGESGMGAAILAKKKGLKVFVSENGAITTENKKVLSNNEIDWEEKGHSMQRILSAEEIVKSPGIPDNSTLMKKIIKQSINVISEVEFASRFTAAKIVAITGSNGKTTTTLLIGHILKKAGYDVLVAGNTGTGFAREIVLNITPDHLNRYNNEFEKYVASKLRISMNQNKEDLLIYNEDDITIRKNIKTNARRVPFTLKNQIKGEGAFYKDDKININLNNNKMTIQELALQGRHNIYNSMAAAITGRILDVKNDIIRQSMLDFQNVEHRLEFVLSVHGIDFVNDSKATNVNATWYALESMSKSVIWIAGGVDKGNDYTEIEDLVKARVKAIICIGESAEKIKKHFKKITSQIQIYDSMKDAVQTSYQLGNKGDVVLLSPACASFDMFHNFEQRGLEFKRQVRKL